MTNSALASDDLVMNGSVTAASTSTMVARIVDDLVATIPPGVVPAIGLCSCTVDVDVAALVRHLQARVPSTVCVGTTSCQRVSSDRGVDATAAVLWLWGDDVKVGAASGIGRGRAFGEKLAQQACTRANLSAGDVNVVVVHATPGNEEGVLEGLAAVVPANAVVIGGSGADNDLTGRWRVWGPDGAVGDGAAVLLCRWPGRLAVSYQGSYLASGQGGRVTASRGRRILSIDDRPAVDVYEQWVEQSLPRETRILNTTTLRPLAVAHSVGGLDSHLLLMPTRVHSDGGISCLAEAPVGSRIVPMESTMASLIRRGGLVSKYALQHANMAVEDVVAGLIVYCAGCSMAMGADVKPMHEGVMKVLPRVPFLMPYTFGEQGRLRRAAVDHGNLMLSVLLLAR